MLGYFFPKRRAYRELGYEKNETKNHLAFRQVRSVVTILIFGGIIIYSISKW